MDMVGYNKRGRLWGGNPWPADYREPLQGKGSGMNSLPQHPRPQQPFLRAAKLAVVLYAGLGIGGIVQGAEPFLRIPEQDRAMIHRAAAEYRLTYEQRRLLFAIRLAEQGGPGREMGVLHPKAMRYAGDHRQSLLTQARWAAGTIRKRYAGDLAAFAARWCPRDAHELNKHWLPNMRAVLRKGR